MLANLKGSKKSAEMLKSILPHLRENGILEVRWLVYYYSDQNELDEGSIECVAANGEYIELPTSVWSYLTWQNFFWEVADIFGTGSYVLNVNEGYIQHSGEAYMTEPELVTEAGEVFRIFLNPEQEQWGEVECPDALPGEKAPFTLHMLRVKGEELPSRVFEQSSDENGYVLYMDVISPLKPYISKLDDAIAQAVRISDGTLMSNRYGNATAIGTGREFIVKDRDGVITAKIVDGVCVYDKSLPITITATKDDSKKIFECHKQKEAFELYAKLRSEGYQSQELEVKDGLGRTLYYSHIAPASEEIAEKETPEETPEETPMIEMSYEDLVYQYKHSQAWEQAKRLAEEWFPREAVTLVVQSNYEYDDQGGYYLTPTSIYALDDKGNRLEPGFHRWEEFSQDFLKEQKELYWEAARAENKLWKDAKDKNEPRASWYEEPKYPPYSGDEVWENLEYRDFIFDYIKSKEWELYNQFFLETDAKEKYFDLTTPPTFLASKVKIFVKPA